MCAFSRWNMTSCCSGANRPQTSSATNPSRRPAAPLQLIVPAAASPAQLRSLIWKWSWKTASSPSTKLYLTRSSPASRKQKWTLTRTGAQVKDNDRQGPVEWSWFTILGLAAVVVCQNNQGCFGINISRGSRWHPHTHSLVHLTHTAGLFSPVILTHLCFCLSALFL